MTKKELRPNRIDGKLAIGELMSQADSAMYRAKAQGGNRVVAV